MKVFQSVSYSIYCLPFTSGRTIDFHPNHTYSNILARQTPLQISVAPLQISPPYIHTPVPEVLITAFTVLGHSWKNWGPSNNREKLYNWLTGNITLYTHTSWAYVCKYFSSCSWDICCLKHDPNFQKERKRPVYWRLRLRTDFQQIPLQ